MYTASACSTPWIDEPVELFIKGKITSFEAISKIAYRMFEFREMGIKDSRLLMGHDALTDWTEAEKLFDAWIRLSVFND